jgi:hypothetical protein
MSRSGWPDFWLRHAITGREAIDPTMGHSPGTNALLTKLVLPGLKVAKPHRDRPLGELVVTSTRRMLLDHGKTPAVVALAAPLGTASALEADQALLHGLAPPLVIDPDAVVVLV